MGRRAREAPPEPIQMLAFAGEPVFARSKESAIARALEARHRRPLSLQGISLLVGRSTMLWSQL
jgi:hypothetical protein